MKYSLYARLVKFLFKGSVYQALQIETSDLVTAQYKREVGRQYRAIVERTEGLGGIKHNPMEVILLFTAFVIAVYKAADGRIDEPTFDKVIIAMSTSKMMQRITKREGAFSDKTIALQKRLAAESKLKQYKNEWLFDFDYQAGSGEYFITYKACGICKMARQEGVFHLAKYLCKMDYYTFAYKGVVLARTKTLAYGDDHCNFHIMKKEKAKALGYQKGADAK